MRALAAVALVAGVVGAPWVAQAGPWYRPTVMTRPDGLTVMVEALPNPLVSLRIVVLAGTGHERENQRGVATVLGRLVLTGSAAVDEGTLRGRLRHLGATVGVSTLRHATVFALDAPPATFDEASKALMLGLSSPRLDADRIDREIKIAGYEAFRFAADDPGRVVGEAAYGQATLRSLRTTVKADALLEFYRKEYRPHRMIVIATGDISSAGVHRVLDDAFLLPGVPEQATEERRMPPRLPARMSGRGPARQFIYGYGACPAGGVDSAPCFVLGELLRERVAAKVRTELTAGADVGGGYVEVARDGFVIVRISSGRWTGVLEQTAAAFAEIVEPPAEAEVRRAIERLDSRRGWARAHPPRLADEYVGHAVSGRRTAVAYRRLEDAVRAVTPERLVEAAAAYIVPERKVTIGLTPLGR